MANRSYRGDLQYTGSYERTASSFESPAWQQLPDLQIEDNNPGLPPTLPTMEPASTAATGPVNFAPGLTRLVSTKPIEEPAKHAAKLTAPVESWQGGPSDPDQQPSRTRENQQDTFIVHDAQASRLPGWEHDSYVAENNKWGALEDIALFKIMHELLPEPNGLLCRSSPPIQRFQQRLTGEGYDRSLSSVQYRFYRHLRRKFYQGWTLEQFSTWRIEQEN